MMTLAQTGSSVSVSPTIPASGAHEWESRWDRLRLPEKTVSALRDLYTVYDRRIYEFFTSLWDPSVGGFYFSASARDNEGFLPDIESTAQILQFLSVSGLVASPEALKDALPPEVSRKLSAFVRSMEDPEDGYFYHRQWGKNINDTRRGRDLSWATQMLQDFGITPVAPTADERLSSGITGVMPPYLADEAAFLAHLDRVTVSMSTSYGWAHRLNAISSQIVAAGLGQCAVDYFNEKANPVTGLWSDTVNYDTVSAVMKIRPLYALTGNPFPYADRTLESCIRVASGDEPPKYVVFIYNPWNGISALRATISGSSLSVGAMNDRLAEAAPVMLRRTKEKLSLFQKEDGTFSYYPDRAMSNSQGVIVGLGLNEGDVNSTKIALASVLSSIFGALGESTVPVYPLSEMARFNALLPKVSRHPKA